MSTEKYLLPNQRQALTEVSKKAPAEYLDFQTDYKGSKLVIAINNGENSVSPAEKASDNWPSGAPVTKTFKKATAPIPKGEFWVLVTDKYHYWMVKGAWYATQNSKITTPPFDY